MLNFRLLSACKAHTSQHAVKTGKDYSAALQQAAAHRSRRQAPPAPRAAVETSSQPSIKRPALLTLAEVQRTAAARGLCLQVKTLGPFYRIVCRDGRSHQQRTSPSSWHPCKLPTMLMYLAGDEEGRVLGVTSGFLVPFLRLMHCDTLQIFTKGIKGKDGERVRGGPLGLGLLIGAATFAYGYEAGCRKAEILAINDDDVNHSRLVKYYRRFGFVPVREVTGDSLADLPHMLVWGGVGTRLDADVPHMISLWAEAFRRTWVQQPEQQQDQQHQHQQRTAD